MRGSAGLLAAWAEVASLHDPVADDPEATAVLRDPEEHRDAIEAAIANMRLADGICGEGLTAMGYDACFEPALWRRGGEAALQARLLQVVCMWFRAQPQDAVLLSDVLVRGTFDADYSLATPYLMLHGGVNFLVVPFVYGEFLMLFARALAQWLAPDDGADAWGALAGGAVPSRSPGPPPAFRQLVARIVTSDRFEPLDGGPNPVDMLREEGGWFATASEDGEPSPLEFALGYCGLDFALCHELAHRVAGHLSGPRGDPLPEEVEADDIGLRLFGASHAWRDELIEDAPLSPGARILLGPVWFFHSASLLLTLKSLLGARLERVAPAADLVRILRKERAHLATVATRWHAQTLRLAEWRERDAGWTAADSATLTALATACERFVQLTVGWIEGIADDELRRAAYG